MTAFQQQAATHQQATIHQQTGARSPAPVATARVGIGRRLGGVALSLLGGGAGWAIVWTHANRFTEPWYPWAALGVLLGLLAGWSFGHGLARCREIGAWQPVRWGRVVPAALVVAVVAAGALPLALLLLPRYIIWQGLALAGLGLVGAVPAGAAVLAVRAVATGELVGAAGRQLAVIIALRQLLSRLVVVFGALVVVLTLLAYGPSGFATAQHAATTGERVPGHLIIYTGAASAVVVALLYLPTAMLLRRRAVRFVDEEFPLDGVDRAHLAQAAHDRQQMEEILGLRNPAVSGQLRSVLAILAPLLAGAGSTLLPGF